MIFIHLELMTSENKIVYLSFLKECISTYTCVNIARLGKQTRPKYLFNSKQKHRIDNSQQ